jgi:drug/metabolite transporter (DMT)-like permease
MLTALRAAPTAILLLLAWPILRYAQPRGRAIWWGTAISGVLMVAVFLAGFTEAILRAGPGNAIVLASTAPFFVAIFSRILFGERLPLATVVGLVVGFAGVVLIDSSQLGGQGNDIAHGMVFAIAASIGWAAGTLVVKEMFAKQPELDLVGLTTWQYVFGGIVLLVIAFAAEGTGGTEWSSVDLWWSLAFVSIVGSALATVAYFGALRRLSATRVAAWTFLSPVVAVLLEIVLGHTPKPIVLVGMAVTIAGVAIVNSGPQRAPAGVPETTEPAGAVEAS